MAFFAQQDHMRVFHFIVDCLDFMGKQMHLLFLPFFGTSDQPCWLAEACKILLLFLLLLHHLLLLTLIQCTGLAADIAQYASKYKPDNKEDRTPLAMVLSLDPRYFPEELFTSKQRKSVAWLSISATACQPCLKLQAVSTSTLGPPAVLWMLKSDPCCSCARIYRSRLHLKACFQ